MPQTSYVVGDTGRGISFDVRDGILHVSGRPGYYFWRYNGDDPAVEDRLLNSVRIRIRLAENTARQSIRSIRQSGLASIALLRKFSRGQGSQ